MNTITDIRNINPQEIETYALSFGEKFKNFLPTLLTALIIFAVGYVFSRFVVFLIGKGLKRSKLDSSAHNFLKTMIKIVLYVLVVVIALSSLGADLTSIVAVIGAAGLAIGLALQSSLSNVAGGFIILFSKPFKKGDFIEINGVTGNVQEISILSTTLFTIDNKVVRIPNGQLSSSTLINYTEEPVRRLDIDFSVGYECDYRKAIELIRNAINENPKSIPSPEPFVRMTEHSTNAIIITARVWVQSAEYFDLKSDLLENVKDAFDENGITIPYSQLVVHKA